MKKIAIFASGKGTNARSIIAWFEDGKPAQVALVLTNNPQAKAVNASLDSNVPVVVFNRQELEDRQVLDLLKKNYIDLVVLAGFLWLLPPEIIRAYPGRIVNIHPALLPKFGGKGMYGRRVHESVLRSGDKVTGITIHFVNERYDEGDIIRQFNCEVSENDTPETLAEKVRQLEHRHYPLVIEELVRQF